MNKYKLKKGAEELLKQLTPREQKVMEYRYGVGEDSTHTLEEVGQLFGVTRERIRQMEAKAIARCGGIDKLFDKK